MPTMIFVSMPVKDLEKSKAFFEALGWGIDPRFTNEKAVSVVMSDSIYAMMLTEEFFSSFLKNGKGLADARRVNEMSCTISMPSREAVDALIEKALAAGAKDYNTEEHGEWMYARDFEDLDGHVWGLCYMDMSKWPANPSQAQDLGSGSEHAD